MTDIDGPDRPPELPEPESPEPAGARPDPDAPGAPAALRRRRPNWILWGLLVVASSFVLVLAAVLSLARGLKPPAPSIASGTTVTIDLARPFPEDRLYDIGGAFIETPELTFRELLVSIDAARDDPRVAGLLLRVRGTQLGWANTFELRSKLASFADSGKPVSAHIEYASTRDYVIATAAEHVYLHPRASIDLRGVRAELVFLRSALDKIGVEAEFERFGDYKDAPDTFLRDGMSAASREALGGVVQTIHDALVAAIAEGRGLTPEQAESLLRDGPFTAATALDRKLVDGLMYLDEVEDDAGAGEASGKQVAVESYRFGQRPPLLGTQGKIAIIYGLGAIVGGASGSDGVFGQVMGSDTIAQAFETVREDDDIDAVVFRIDSPGGSDVASDVIWREARLTRDKKPVVVSMGNVAASGGYWIATASDTLVAEPTTITGSIGIYGGKFNLAGLYEKLGVSREGVSSSDNADFYSDSRPFTEAERARFRAMIAEGYDAFLARVAEARDMSVQEVHDVAQGRVWSGRAARERSLVDELGGLDRALEIAKEKAGYGASDKVEIVVYPEKKTLLEVLLSGLLSSRSRSPEALDALELAERSVLLRTLMRGGRLAMMPFELKVE